MLKRTINVAGYKIRISDIPFGDEDLILEIPNDQNLEHYFEEDILGYPNGSEFMYRGPYNIHILEYPTYYAVHRDYCDPRYDPLGHIDQDAPELKPVIVAGLALGGLALGAYLLSKYDNENE